MCVPGLVVFQTGPLSVRNFSNLSFLISLNVEFLFPKQQRYGIDGGNERNCDNIMIFSLPLFISVLFLTEVASLDLIREFKLFYTFNDQCEFNASSTLDYSSSGRNTCGSRRLKKYDDGTIECFFINNDLLRYQNGRNEALELGCLAISDSNDPRLIELDGTIVEGRVYQSPTTGKLYNYSYTIIDSAENAMRRNMEPVLSEYSLKSIYDIKDTANAMDSIKDDDIFTSGIPIANKPLNVLILTSTWPRLAISDVFSCFEEYLQQKQHDDYSSSYINKLHILSEQYASTNYNNSSSSSKIDMKHLMYSDIGITREQLRTIKELDKWYDPRRDSSDASDMNTNRIDREIDIEMNINEETTTPLQKLLFFFSSYDVLIYDDVGWSRSSDVGRLVNVAWATNNVALIRMITSATQLQSYIPKYFSDTTWYPGHMYFLDSHLHQKKISMKIQVGGHRSIRDITIVIPPVIDEWLRHRDVIPTCDDFISPPTTTSTTAATAGDSNLDDKLEPMSILFIGRGQGSSSPGAFLRIAARMRERYPNLFSTGKFRWTMLDLAIGESGTGAVLLDEMYALRAFLKLQDYVQFIDVHFNPITKEDENSDKELELVNLLKKSHLLVMTSPTEANGGYVPVLAGLYGIPVVALKSSAATEWIYKEQLAYLVDNVSTIAITDALVSIYNGNHNDAYDQTHRCNIQKQLLSDNFRTTSHATKLVIKGLMTAYNKAQKEKLSMPQPIRIENVKIKDASSFSSNTTTSTIRGSSTSYDIPFSPSTIGWRDHINTINDSIYKSGDCSNLLDEHDLKVLNAQRRPLSSSFDSSSSSSSSSNEEKMNSKGGLLCMIYTISSKDTQLQAIANTWGRHCDGFIAFSNETNVDLHAVLSNHPGGESYHNMWSKAQYMWMTAATKMSHYDWFLIGGDDLFVSISALKYYLSSSGISDAHSRGMSLYIGRAMRESFHFIYNNGGSGYLLNSYALQELYTELLQGCNGMAWTRIQSSKTTFNAGVSGNEGYSSIGVRASVEDMLVGYCLARRGVFPIDTADYDPTTTTPMETEGRGKERFHWHRPGAEFRSNGRLYSHLSVNAAPNLDCCSPHSVTFHYIDSPTMMYCMHLYLRAEESM